MSKQITQAYSGCEKCREPAIASCCAAGFIFAFTKNIKEVFMERIYSAQEQHNRDVVIDYYTKLICHWDFAAASAHLGDHFIQHNPTIPDGLDGVKAFAENVPQFVKENLKTEIRRVLVDGDFVVVHTMNTLPGTNGRAIADFFRLENGKVVEHWDVLQDVPEDSLHLNPIA